MTDGDADVAPGTELSVPLHSRRRNRLLVVQKAQHLIPAAGLLFSGIQSLQSDAHGVELALAVGGIVTSALLLAAFARHLRNQGTHQAVHAAHGVDWMDIFAAGVLFAEAAEKYHVRGHLFRPESLAAAVTLGIGLLHARLAAASERRAVGAADARPPLRRPQQVQPLQGAVARHRRDRGH